MRNARHARVCRRRECMTGSRNQAETERARGFWVSGPFRSAISKYVPSLHRGGQGHTTRCPVQQCSLVVFVIASALLFWTWSSRGGFRHVEQNFCWHTLRAFSDWQGVPQLNKTRSITSHIMLQGCSSITKKPPNYPQNSTNDMTDTGFPV